MGIFDDVLENVGEPFRSTKGFEAGSHEVIIGEVQATVKNTKKSGDAEVINVIVFDEEDNDKTATCTLWFHTEGGAKVAVSKTLGLMVHNVGEEKKDKVRELGKKLFGTISDPKEARKVVEKLMNDKMIGYKAYLIAAPQNGYTTTSFGDLSPYPIEKKNDLLDGATDVTDEVDLGDI